MHIPYEGCTGGDVLVVPHWLGFNGASAERKHSVGAWLFEKAHKYVISPRYWGAFPSESCRRFGNWAVYVPLCLSGD